MADVTPANPYLAFSNVEELLGELLVKMDHIAICVGDIEAAGAAWSKLVGRPVVDREDVVAQKTTVGFLRPAAGDGATAIELISPMEGNQGLTKFLARRGDGFHHIAFEVSDIDAALARLTAAGVALIDKQPRPGACGHTVAFIHPKAMGGTLIELVAHGHE